MCEVKCPNASALYLEILAYSVIDDNVAIIEPAGHQWNECWQRCIYLLADPFTVMQGIRPEEEAR